MVYYLGNGVYYMPKGKPHKKYDGDFKVKVVETMQRESLSLSEAARRFGVSNHHLVARWERLYMTEGKASLYEERRGRVSAANRTRKIRKPKMDKQVEEDLIAEVQRLRMENEYLKKLRALVLEEERQNKKHK